MSESIIITTGARLHFGPLSYRPRQGRHFGGVGVMVDQPGLRVRLRRAGQDRFRSLGATTERLQGFAATYRERCGDEQQPPGCEVIVEQDLPSHNGLGSGTQIGLALARGLSILAGETDVDAAELARRVGRGRRSAVGIHGFERGGLIVDAGHSAAEPIGALACRLPMPEVWRVLLISPRGGATGLSGESEEHAFESLGTMPNSLTDRLCRLVVTELLPTVQAACFDGFGRAVEEYGRLVGEFFAPVQGGIFGHPQADALLATLREQGIHGAGQTSWGPTVFAFVPDASVGERIAEGLRSQAEVRVVRLLNAGAEVTR